MRQSLAADSSLSRRQLHAGLAVVEAFEEQARALEASREQQARALVDELSLQHIRREAVISALQSDKTLAPGLREMALRIAETSGELTAYGCNSAAWPLVDPDRTRKDTDVAHGLKLARRGVELGPEDFRVHDTLAWALFANGKDDEAIAAAEKALELAPDQHKAKHQSYLDRLRRLIEQR